MEIVVPELVEHTVHLMDVNEEGRQYIVSFGNESFYKISEGIKLIIDEIDGEKNFAEISSILKRKYNAQLDPKFIQKVIINDLGSKGLVKGVEASYDASSESKLWFHIRLLDGKHFEKLALNLTFLFKWPFALSILGLSIFISAYQIENFGYFYNSQFNDNIGSVSIIMVFLSFLFVIGHEFGHIVASYSFKVRPRDVGIGLYLFMPVFYVDLREVWILNKRQRAIINAAGFYFQFIMLLLFSPMMLMNNAFFNKDIYNLLINFNIVILFFNLNPLIRGDGYWILADLLGIVNIHQRTTDVILNYIRKIFRSSQYDSTVNYQLRSTAKTIFYFWSIGYTLFIVWAITRVFIIVINYFKNGAGMPNVGIILLIMFLIVQAVVPAFKNIAIKSNKKK